MNPEPARDVRGRAQALATTTVMVSGASGIVGYGVLRSLRASGKPLRLIGTSIYDDSVAPAFCDVFELAPPTGSDGYMAWLVATLRKHDVDLLVPGIEIDMYAWIEHVPQITEAGAIPVLNRPDLVRLCKDKWNFYLDLCEAGLACAISSSLSTDFDALAGSFGLPFLLKPRRGFASKGIVRVQDRDTFQRYAADVGRLLMAQALLGTDDAEFTTSAFCDGAGGFTALMTLKRKLSREGFTDRAEVVPSGRFVPAMQALCKRYRPLGPTNFQFRDMAAGPKLLEINPRISSSTSIRTAFGYNEGAMVVDYFIEQRLPVQPHIRRGRAIRYTDEQVFYDDRIHL